MSMDYVTLIGFGAGAIVVTSYIPQVIKVHARKSAKDFYWPWLLPLEFGIAVWVFYGALVSSLPVIISNGILFILVTVMIALKFTYEYK